MRIQFFRYFPPASSTTRPYQYAPNGPQTSDPTYSYFYDPNAAFPNGGSDIADLLTGVPTTVNMGLQLTTRTHKAGS